ncbi:transcription initiation protein [Aurantimonas sp. VKM B-3413]|uniref:transcription initiation protein n=1 Tax=Aurantimonas sp. VKM B-3413 TaxID=2779401 RepID=UPI001E379F03|nr:transcription initiation protein [Aurantimonas sp. VKM B-3413]MCB8836806.1 transcription initiation protein [Aurantimonas sp. VKM B-3413]
MPKFVTIGYGDEAGYDQTSLKVRDAAHAHDAGLVRDGALMGIAGQPVQVRNHDDRGVTIEPGAYSSSALPVAGFALIDAADLAEAVEQVSKSPCAVARGVVEVWPLEEGFDV